MSELSLILVLSLATYRATRFVIKDTIIMTLRLKALTAIVGENPGEFRMKVHELLTCPYCISVWLAASAVALADIWSSVPLPVFTWGAVAAGCLMTWRYIEE